jgi:hypothetical protein
MGGAKFLKGGDIPRRFVPLGGEIPNSPRGGEYPRNIAPLLRGGANLLGGVSQKPWIAPNLNTLFFDSLKDGKFALTRCTHTTHLVSNMSFTTDSVSRKRQCAASKVKCSKYLLCWCNVLR